MKMSITDHSDGAIAVEICQAITGGCTCLPQGSPDEHYVIHQSTNCAAAMRAALAWNRLPSDE